MSLSMRVFELIKLYSIWLQFHNEQTYSGTTPIAAKIGRKLGFLAGIYSRKPAARSLARNHFYNIIGNPYPHDKAKFLVLIWNYMRFISS